MEQGIEGSILLDYGYISSDLPWRIVLVAGMWILGHVCGIQPLQPLSRSMVGNKTSVIEAK